MVEASVVGIRTSIMGKDMQTQRFVLSLMLVAGAALSMSCAASQDSGEAEPKLVATYDELVAALRTTVLPWNPRNPFRSLSSSLEVK